VIATIIRRVVAELRRRLPPTPDLYWATVARFAEAVGCTLLPSDMTQRRGKKRRLFSRRSNVYGAVRSSRFWSSATAE
jgi:hypothetical protein